MKLTRHRLNEITKEELLAEAEATASPFGTGMEQLRADDPEAEELVSHT